MPTEGTSYGPKNAAELRVMEVGGVAIIFGVENNLDPRHSQANPSVHGWCKSVEL